MNVLELVLKYENVFEDYIKYSQNKDNKNRKSAFFVKKCNEVQALLNDFMPEEVYNEDIKRFII